MDEELSDGTDEEILDAPPVHLPDYQVSFRDCADQETAERIASCVNSVVKAIARYLPLDRLDGFTFAYDYAAALQELDRGFGATEVLAPTQEDFGVGVAMSPTVLRDGVIKTHVVMGGWFAHALIGESEEDRSLAIHTIAHELSHVGCHRLVDEALPGVMLRPIEDQYERILYWHSNACWDEYFASRWSAAFDPGLIDGYRETVIAALEQADQRIRSAKTRFWLDRDLETVVDEALTAIGSVMKFSGYLLGHADGANLDIYDADGRLAGALKELELRDWFDTMHERVRQLFDLTGEWKDFSAFFVLNESVVEAAESYLIFCERSEETPMRVQISG